MATMRKRTWTTASGAVRQAWCIDFIDQSGMRRRLQFRTKREADGFLIKARAAAAQGAYVHRPESPTISEAAATWLHDVKARVGIEIERKTFADYASKARLHILSHEYGIAHMPIVDLTFAVADRFRLKMIRAGVTKANAAKVIAVLRSFASWCVDEKYLAANPLIGRRAKRGTRERRKPTVPSHDAVRKLIEAAEARDAHFGLYVRLAALTGLRASEQRGLRWPHVSLDKGEITVSERLDCYGHIGLPKTEAGHRTVPIPPKLRADLRELWLRQGRPSDGFIFRNRLGHAVCHDNMMKRRFRPACTAAGVRFRWHDLRAYAISSWLQAGLSVKEVQRRAGHADHNVTLAVYAVAMPDEAAGAELAAIEGRLS